MGSAKKIGKRTKKTKLSKVPPTMTSPVQVGTTELISAGLFGPRIARIRTEAEAAKSVKVRSNELQKMLGEICADLPPTGTPQLGLIRNREIQQRLVQKAQAAAEHVWPGYNALMRALMERENEFVTALGEIGLGIA